jgi:hypothetical protein
LRQFTYFIGRYCYIRRHKPLVEVKLGWQKFLLFTSSVIDLFCMLVTGVMKQVGDALGDWMTQAKNNIVTIGIAPWGIVHSRNELIGRDIEAPYYSSASHGNNTGIALNSNHSYFLLVDNGTVGKYGCEITFRRRLEKHISHQKIRTRMLLLAYNTWSYCFSWQAMLLFSILHTHFIPYFCGVQPAGISS